VVASRSLDAIGRRLGVDLISEQAQIYDAGLIAAAMARSPWHRDLVSADPARAALIVGVKPDTVMAVSGFVVDAWDTGAELRLLDLEVETAPPVDLTPGELIGALAGAPEDTAYALWVAAGDPIRSIRSAATLTRIMATLRAPGGCPWDREQTSRSQREGVLNEAYEVVDAIDAGDDRNLAEELGDVLMAIVLQAQIAADDDRFTLADVYAAINAKMIRRHPHVFADVTVSGTEDIVANWARIKADEKTAAGVLPLDQHDPLAKYPTAMPALRIARELLRKDRVSVRGEELAGITAASVMEWYIQRLVAGEDPDADLRDAVRKLASD
jgi:tetrapyrrole methylase family protein/MazG family protein